MEKHGTPESKGDCDQCSAEDTVVIPVDTPNGIQHYCRGCFDESEKQAAAPTP